MQITEKQTLGEIVNALPGAAELFNRRGIDYCCGGDRSLAEAAGGESAKPILKELRELAHGAPEQEEWREMDSAQLIEHIIRTHHHFTRQELSELDPLIQRVLQAHYAAHRDELIKVHRLYGSLKTELQEHLIYEEALLFPMLLELKEGANPEARESLIDKINQGEEEHEAAGQLLHDLQRVSRNFSPPEDACASFRELYSRLQKLTEDIFLHIHKENNILFKQIPSPVSPNG